MKEFGDLEAAIMDALWRAQRPLTLREMHARLDYDRTLALTTIATVAAILHRKGLVKRRKARRAWLYRPYASRAEHTARTMHDVFSTCRGDATLLLHFVEAFSDQDLIRLADAVDQVRAQRAACSPARARPPVFAGGPRTPHESSL